jgi:hypothetical protein
MCVCEENTILNCMILDKAVGLVRGYKFNVDKLIHVNPYLICTPKPETLMRWHVAINFIVTSLYCSLLF